MPNFEKALVITHIVYRKVSPYEPLEGPYSTDCTALTLITQNNVETCQIPLFGFNNPVIYGKWKSPRQVKILTVLGKLSALKYIVDFFIITFFLFKFCFSNRTKNKLVVGIDPLSCFPLTLFKKFLGYKLIFHSVDFSKNRFKNKLLQKLYEIADGVSTKFSDQTWVVCESLQKYKKIKFNIESFYMPNSPIFNDIFYKDGEKIKRGNKMAWTGSISERSLDILFKLLSEIQGKIRKDMEFYLAPTMNHDKFTKYSKKYKLKKVEVLNLCSRLEWQKTSAAYDVGIAIYDEEFAEFIEPTKIWDFILCGMPFVISSEPSVSTPIKKAGVAYILEPHNRIPNNESLNEFLKPENLKKKQEKCLELAKEYDIKKQIEKRLLEL